LFKANEQAEYRNGQPDGGEPAHAAALSHNQVVPDDEPAPSLRERLAGMRQSIERRCAGLDLAPDLSEDIGSARWLRGMATMVGLGAIAIAMWPNVSAIETARAMPADAPVRDEFRSQMIMPLALGADSGRRMGATPAVVPLAEAPERPMVRLAATLGQGDSFARMLQRAGVGAGDADRVASRVSARVPLADIEPGTRIDITLGRRPEPGASRPLDALSFRARFDLDLAVERKGGALMVEQRPILVDSTPLRIRGQVGSGLYRSARAAGAPVEAIRQYLKAIDEHVRLESDISSSDEFDLIVEYKRSAKGESELGKLLYAGIVSDGKPKLQLLRWGKDGQFFEASGVGKETARQYAPVAGRLTSRYGLRRHPILGYKRMHSGIDFGARHGAPIYAVSDGRVTYSGRHGGHGNYVRIEHAGGLGSGYAHMSRIAVRNGAYVRAGQVIGYVGSTGLSTGPHLHFEVYRGSRKINPLSVKFTSQARIDKAELGRFKSRLGELLAVEPGAALASLAPKQAEVKTPLREIDRIEQPEL
jgi:murein DD-endopeptidase MepM/ murein hydrolase activator NlpD